MGPTKRTLTQKLGLLGVVSFLSYTAAVVFAPLAYHDVENLTRESFWNVYRPGCMEHYVLHCYRDDPAFVPELDFVMELDGELIGQVIYVR